MLFEDREHAAVMLAEKLQWLKEAWGTSLIVLAIPRGGIVIGDIIAKKLGVNLDIVVAKKVGDPLNPEFAIGAVMHDGSFTPNEDVINSLKLSQQYIDNSASALKKEIDRRLINFRGSSIYHLVDKAVLLVDDGVATGTTMFAAIKWLKSQNLKTLIVIVPVGPLETIEKLRATVDDVSVLYSPSAFGSVGRFYQDFSLVTDDKVKEIMDTYRAEAH